MSFSESIGKSAYADFQTNISLLQITADIVDTKPELLQKKIDFFKNSLNCLEQNKKGGNMSRALGFPIDVPYLRTMASVLEYGLECPKQVGAELEVYYQKMPKLPLAVSRISRGI